MDSIFRIVNTLKNDENSKKERGAYTLQFVDYVETEDSDEPLEVVANSIDLVVGQILKDAMNMSEGLDRASFAISDDSTTDQVRYIQFIKDINNGLSKDALQFCYSLYDDFYNLGRSRDAYVPTMNVKMELDCSDEGYLEEYYYIESFEDMLVYDFYSAVKGRFAIKKCQLCGTYFITQNRTDELYCSAECRSVISKQRSKIHHRLDDENELLKRRIASRLQQRTKVSNPALREDREQIHQQFLYDVKQWKKKIKNGQSSPENYKLWLQAQDIKYATMLERKEPLVAEARPTSHVIKNDQVAPVEERPQLDQAALAERLAALATPKVEDLAEDVLPDNPKDAAEAAQAWNEELASYLPPEERQIFKEAQAEEVNLEQQGINADIKARLLNFGKAKKNVQAALFSGMSSYEDIEKQVEDNNAEDLDFGAFIKNTYGASIEAAEQSSAKDAKVAETSERMIGNMIPTNIRKTKFPIFESVLAASEREEAEAREAEARASEVADPEMGTTFSVEDMKARTEAQKAALKAQGLDDLLGLLEDEENR